ncbi:hypothetical protein Bca52824_000698 [Brassica carinata]|uniref:DUF223 domain-containing protein n=1 Tax=Brassica carinata TaxID=52824 RepID=A0A8X7WK05_BRACI|nr:hypothetical protein Bca52824_000698 [Brassica carinata]
MLIGLEMLLIDQEGFIPAERIETYLPHMKAGGIYRLHNFYGSHNKTLYRVAEPSFTITFSSTSVLSDLEDSSVCFPEDRFRFHGYEEFDAACDLKGDLYDYVGHIKIVNGKVLNDILVLDEAHIASTRRVLLHVQTHDGPVMNLNLWDKAASDFSERFKASEGTASVIFSHHLKSETIWRFTLSAFSYHFKKLRRMANENVGDDPLVPVPQALIDTI